MDSLQLGAAFLMGLLGGVHCMGMCGGIIVALTAGQKKVWWLGVAAYQAARIGTYMALGLAASLAGTFLTTALPWPYMQKGISVFAGATVILFALQLGGWVPQRWAGLPLLIPSHALKKASTSGSLWAWGVVGFFNGLLPCGLVYAALAVAFASGGWLSGSLIMLAFGLGTVPAFFAVSAVMRFAGPAMRGGFIRAVALLLVLYGGWMAVRGFADHRHAGHDGHKHPAHHSPAAE